MSDPRFERLLHDLEVARRAARARTAAAITGTAPPAVGRPSTSADRLATQPQASARTGPAPAPSAAPSAPSGPVPSSARGRFLAVARMVAALVVTAAAVLGGWLLVLEPALGSRPVLVRDELMSPSLRTGDVALAVDPDGPLGAGAIVAVRVDGRTAVTRVIGREQVPSDATADVRATAGLVVRADGEPLEVSAVVALADVVGEVGAAVPRVGLPLVVAVDPVRAPLGTAALAAVAALTVIGIRESARDRRRPTQ